MQERHCKNGGFSCSITLILTSVKEEGAVTVDDHYCLSLLVKSDVSLEEKNEGTLQGPCKEKIRQ